MKNTLQDQLTKAFREISRKMPDFYDDDAGRLGQSRRVGGMYTTGGDRQGFRNVYFYIERGLGKFNDIISEVVAHVILFMKENGHSDWGLYILSYGGQDDALLLCSKVFKTKTITSSGEITKELCDISGTTASEGTSSIIERLFPERIAFNYAGAQAPGDEDLIVFIKSQKDTLMQENARSKYYRFLKPRSLWLTLAVKKSIVEVGIAVENIEKV